MNSAPFFAEIADGPDGGHAWWRTAKDGVRIRVGLWPAKNGAAQEDTEPKGTVLLFPGRTEYIEKYGRAAQELQKYGYATLAVDWRGQGLADRLVNNAMSGHVDNFSDYQLDVAEIVATATELDLPKPWHLLAHSMGGCIGLRALHLGLPVQTCTFSAPMWGIHMVEALRPVAWSLSWGGRHVGLGHVIAPGSPSESYVLVEPFETNKLTTDPEMYQYMIDQTEAEPGLGLGGPSLLWLHEALKEARDLSRLPSPDVPCLTVVGSDEQIVDVPRITSRMAAWPGSRLEIIRDGKHELLMECPEMRHRVFQMIGNLMSTVRDTHPNAAKGHAPHVAAGSQAPLR